MAKDWNCLHIGYGKGEVFLLDSPCQDASSERADLGAGDFGGCEGGLNDYGLGRATKPNHQLPVGYALDRQVAAGKMIDELGPVDYSDNLLTHFSYSSKDTVYGQHDDGYVVRGLLWLHPCVPPRRQSTLLSSTSPTPRCAIATRMSRWQISCTQTGKTARAWSAQQVRIIRRP